MFRRRRFRSAQLRKEQQRRIVRFTTLWITLFILIIVLLAQVSALSELQIKNISIVGTKALSKKEVFVVVRGELIGKYLYFFPRTNIFMYPRFGIEEELLETIPQIRSVETSIVSRGEVRVEITERKPVGIVCADTSKLEESENVCNFVDEGGFVFAPAPVFSGNTFFEYKEEGRRAPSIGFRFLEQSVFSTLNDLKEALIELGLSPISLTANTYNSDIFARHFTFTIDEGMEIIFSADPEQFEAQLKNLQVILLSQEFEEESGGDISTVEYIDLRFGNKVFYRLQGGISEN